MTLSENERKIEVLKVRYALDHIDLNPEQAEKIFLFEIEKRSGPHKYFFSIWEEMDFEQATFQTILNEIQFKIYLSNKESWLKQIEKNLIENDNQYLRQLNAAKEKLIYYNKTFIPDLRKYCMPLNLICKIEKEKIGLLKSEYEKYLIDEKKNILIEHFRHSKTFQPIILELSLIRHDFNRLFPDYHSFKTQMDNPTKIIADYLEGRLANISEEIYNSLKNTILKLKEFNKSNTAKNIGEVKGWHLTIKNKEMSKSEEIMFAVLLDNTSTV